jgi:hypothetical protein
MQAHPHPDTVIGEITLCLLGGRHGGICLGERNEERVTLGIDFNAPVARDGVAHDSAVSGQRLGISLGT